MCTVDIEHTSQTTATSVISMSISKPPSHTLKNALRQSNKKPVCRRVCQLKIQTVIMVSKYQHTLGSAPLRGDKTIVR